MKLNALLVGALALTLTGTGCATKKYVQQTVAPVENRVAGTETKNVEQDDQLTAQNQQLSSQGEQIVALETDLSHTNELLGDTDAKATAAAESAASAGQRADGAQRTADGAQTLAQRGVARADEVEQTLTRRIDASNRFQLTASETVLFALDSFTLTDDAKAKLADLAARTHENARYVIEIQGFTDKTGTPAYNERLSEQRADTVSRYLVNEHKIPLRSITTIGSGYALPVADDSTSEGRKMNRRVEVRLFVPETASGSTVAAARD